MRLKIIGPDGDLDLKVKAASATMLVNQLRHDEPSYMTLNGVRMRIKEARVHFTVEDDELVANTSVLLVDAPTEIHLRETE